MDHERRPPVPKISHQIISKGLVGATENPYRFTSICHWYTQLIVANISSLCIIATQPVFFWDIAF
jgi:hypothetical protein